MSYFLTDPDNQSDGVHERKPTVKRRGQFFKYCDRVLQELLHLNVPFRAAELALIDFRHVASTAFHDKETPLTAAERLFVHAKQLYSEKDKDGNFVSWHYSSN